VNSDLQNSQGPLGSSDLISHHCIIFFDNIYLENDNLLKDGNSLSILVGNTFVLSL